MSIKRKDGWWWVPLRPWILFGPVHTYMIATKQMTPFGWFAFGAMVGICIAHYLFLIGLPAIVKAATEEDT